MGRVEMESSDLFTGRPLDRVLQERLELRKVMSFAIVTEGDSDDASFRMFHDEDLRVGLPFGRAGCLREDLDRRAACIWHVVVKLVGDLELCREPGGDRMVPIGYFDLKLAELVVSA